MDYRIILERTRAALPKGQILLIDPFYICRDALPEYLVAEEKLVHTFKTRQIKMYELFGRLLEYHEPDTFCPGPLHPNQTGHLAEAICKP